MKRTVCLQVCLLLVLFCCRPAGLLCQETTFSETLISVAEELASSDSDPSEVQAFADRLSELAADPVELNPAGEEDLARLFFLTEFQKKSLSDYIHSSGRIYSVNEICNIPGFNSELASMMKPFITLETDDPPERRSRTKNLLLINYSLKPGAFDTAAPGPPGKFLAKYRLSANKLSAGMTFEKDDGENFFSGNPKMPEFFSSYLSFSGKGFVRKIIAGDYSARFGTGISVNTGPRMSLPLTSQSYMLPAPGIRPYTSADENAFLRGAAAELGKGKLSMILLYSANRIDATCDSTTGRITSFYRSGLHDTPPALRKKDAILLGTLGSGLTFSGENVRAGILMTQCKLSAPVEDSDEPEKKFDFSGSGAWNYTFYYTVVAGRAMFFGEAAANKDLNKAFIQGASLRLSGRLLVNAMYRNMEGGYFSFHAGNPASSSSSLHERSFMGSFTFEAAKNFFISAGCDLRNYPWMKYRTSSPSLESRHEIRLKYLPIPSLVVEALYSHRSYARDSRESSFIPGSEGYDEKSLRGMIKYSPAEKVMISTRIGLKKTGSETGMMMSQDLSCGFRALPLTLWYRYCLFSTTGWDSRLYTWENDLLYSFSVPALYGRGSRTYIMAACRIARSADLRVRYALTSRIGSPASRDARIQLKITF